MFKKNSKLNAFIISTTQKKLIFNFLILFIFSKGCMQLENDIAETDSVDIQAEENSTSTLHSAPIFNPDTEEMSIFDISDEYLAAQDGLGVQINCVAPEREQYILDNTDETLEEGDEDLTARSHVILFVFDRSGSMDFPWDHSNKWQAAADIMIESVSMYQSHVTAGAIFYPSDNQCDVDLIEHEQQIDFMDASQFLAQWEIRTSSYGPNGGTPMNAAFIRADMALARACEMGLMEKPMRVVVLTDGEPNCFFDLDMLTQFPEKWALHGVKTYVVGLPGYGAETLLQDIAKAGNTLAEIVERGISDDGIMGAGTTDELSDHMMLVIY